MPVIAYKTRLIFKSDEDKNKIIEMLISSRSCWNECSKVKFNDVPRNSIVDLHAKFYKEFRQKHPHIPSQIVVIAENAVLSSFKSIKTKKEKITEPPVKKKLSIQLDDRIYSYKNKIFSIVSLNRRVKCSLYLYPKLQELLEKYKFRSPLLISDGKEVFIQIPFTISETPSTQDKSVGVDVGILRYAATSEGNLYQDKQFNRRKRKIRHLRNKLRSARAITKSNSAKKKLKKMQRKEANLNKNFIHHLANKIIKDTKADIIVLENLKSIKVKKHKYQYSKKICQVPMYMLRQFLTYKALLAKKTVIEVCPSYTSQLDHRTNKCDGERRGRRYYSKTGIIYDADINAAINIALRSKLPVSQTERLTYGQAIVNSPIVGRPMGLQTLNRKI